MPRAVPLPIRRVIHRRVERGEDVSVVAEELQLPVRTVRNLVHSFRERDRDLEPAYSHCGRPAAESLSPMMERALALRQEHPGWGSRLIHVILTKDYPGEPVPSERTLRRWLSRLNGARRLPRDADRRRRRIARPGRTTCGRWTPRIKNA